MLRKSLGEKVVGVHLGSSYEVRDPISNILEKKPLKPFLVNQTTLLLERGQLRIPNPKIDEVIHRQMTNYQVVKVSAKTGEPTYTNVDEHALDAMEFALFAFMEKYPELINILHHKEPARLTGFVRTVINDPIQTVAADSFKSGEMNSRNSGRVRRVRIGYSNKKTTSWGDRGSLNKGLKSRRTF